MSQLFTGSYRQIGLLSIPLKCLMVLTQTTSLLNHLKPLLCYVMLDIAGSLCQGSNRQMTFPALPGALQLIASAPLVQQ